MATMMTMTTTMVVETVGEIANLKEQARFKTSLPPGRRGLRCKCIRSRSYAVWNLLLLSRANKTLH